MLILITGLPGSGKTAVARAYAALSGAAHFNSDQVRSSLGLMGHYSDEEKQQVYRTMLERAGAALLENRDVIVDGTFYLASIRDTFEQLAEKHRTSIRWIEVQASENTIRERMKRSRPDSEADFTVYEKLRSLYEPVTQPHLILRTDHESPEPLARSIRDYLSDHDN